MALKVLHIAPLDGNRGSGLNRSIPALARAQADAGAEVSVLATGPEAGMAAAEGLEGRLWNGLSAEAFDAFLGGVDLAVFHSTYVPAHAKIAKHLRAASIPYVITPRGGMTNAAGAVKPLKKAFGNTLFFKRLVRGAEALHFLTKGEATASAHWNKPGFVVGNGVDPAPASFVRDFSPDGPKKFVFIGRLAIGHKGLDLLVEAWAAFKKRFPDSGATLLLYGPDHEGGKGWLDEAVARLKLGDSVRIEGPVYGGEKEAVFRDAAAFLHTSRFEGCPMAVLEALARGVPCLLTPGTFMAEEVSAAGAGIAVGGDVPSIARAFEAVENDEHELGEMGAAARAWAERHSWSSVAEVTLEAYAKLLR